MSAPYLRVIENTAFEPHVCIAQPCPDCGQIDNLPEVFVLTLVADEHLAEVNKRWPGAIRVIIEGKEYLSSGYRIER